MQIFNQKEDCNGCGACEQICSQNCIQMKRDEEGFLYPQIDYSLCVDCQACKEVCKMTDLKLKSNLKIVYAVKNKKDNIRLESSSGGAFYAFASKIIDEEGVVFGAVYDKDFSVYHRSVDNLEDLKLLMKSKYVQSDTRNTYKEVREFLNSERLCLYTGTPCQIAGLKAYLKNDTKNLICISIICHGVPSPEIWKRYLSFLKGRYGEDEIKSINCREKYWGWRDFSLEIKFPEHIYHKIYTEDLYMKGFMQNLYLRPSCYSCRAKGAGQNADIIIGDYWGIEQCHPELDDRKGVSAVVLNSEKGVRLFQSIKDEFDFVPSTYEQVIRENDVLEGSVSRENRRKEFYKEFYATGEIDCSIQNNIESEQISKEERYQYQYPFIMEYLKNKIQGKDISILLNNMGIYKIAIYALTEFAELVYDDLSRKLNKIEIVCISDKNYQKFPQGFRKSQVIGIEELKKQYENGKIDAVLNCSIFHENEVMQELISKDIKHEHIISVINIIFMLRYIL